MNAETQVQSLLDYGYVEVQEHGCLKVGQRVRHVGQQYSEAYNNGTGTLERIFHRPDRGNDVEVIVKRDKPQFGPHDTHGFWANYHTIVIDAEVSEA